MRAAVVTGAGSGIGEATARLLARAGFRVACLDVDQNSAGRVASDIGNKSVAFPLDVSREADVISVFHAIGRDFGHLDALATCAGIMDTAEFMTLDSDKFRRILEVNVLGTFLCLREAAKFMDKGSRICTVASISALRGMGFVGVAPAYTASKGAVLALTKAAAWSLAEKGISVNTVSPGPTLSPMLGAREDDAIGNLVRRFGKPSEIAEAIVFLLSPSASYISGSNLVADGGIALY
jgi:NAD(P)-dependent dehydrogenase (short-subunit alcohol dehydrogenase family)